MSKGEVWSATMTAIEVLAPDPPEGLVSSYVSGVLRRKAGLGIHGKGGTAMALVRSDPYRDVDRLFQQLWSAQQNGPRVTAMPMDAYRKEDSFVLRLDLPGVTPESIDLTVDDDVLTISAERPAAPTGEGVETVIAERTFGTFTRQVLLGKSLDSDRIEATYEGGVLTVTIPVAEQAKPRRIEVNAGSDHENVRIASDPEKASVGPEHKKLSPFHKKPSASTA